MLMYHETKGSPARAGTRKPQECGFTGSMHTCTHQTPLFTYLCLKDVKNETPISRNSEARMEWSQLSAQVIESSLFLRVLFGKEQLVLEAKGMGEIPRSKDRYEHHRG